MRIDTIWAEKKYCLWIVHIWNRLVQWILLLGSADGQEGPILVPSTFWWNDADRWLVGLGILIMQQKYGCYLNLEEAIIANKYLELT